MLKWWHGGDRNEFSGLMYMFIVRSVMAEDIKRETLEIRLHKGKSISDVIGYNQ